MSAPGRQLPGRVLIVAGSDSGGGAGIQADIKTVTALGGYAATAVTALTAQDTLGVHGVFPVPPDFVRRQIEVVLGDIGADCIKTGMLHDAALIEAVAGTLARMAPEVPLVVDPVMTAKGGASLLADAAETALRERLLPRAALVTPNLPEAERLTGIAVTDLDGMRRAARSLHAMGARRVLVKGGHLAGDALLDLYSESDGAEAVLEGRRIATPHTHGTGCTLASAIATGLAQGLRMLEAITRARAYLVEAIRQAPGLGHGHGPLWHGHTVRPFPVPEAGSQ